MTNIVCISLNTNPNLNNWNSQITQQAKLKNDHSILHIYQKMETLHMLPNSQTLPLIFKACSKLKAIETGKRLHNKINGTELINDVRVGSALVDFYGRCGFIEDARRVFDEMADRDVVLWNVMINSYVGCGFYEEGLVLFKRIWVEGLKPTAVTLVALLVACGGLLKLRLGKEVHGYCLRNGLLESSFHLGTALIGFYEKFDVRASRTVFGLMEEKNVVSWNAMINGCLNVGEHFEALELFVKMLTEQVKCDNVTMLVIIQACAELGNLELGKQLHQLAIKFGHAKDLHITNALLNMYGKFCCLESSYKLFRCSHVLDTAMWNSMISVYSESGLHEEALSLFSKMQSEGFQVNEATMTILLPICAEIGDGSRAGKALHAKVIKSKFHNSTVVLNGVMRMYSVLSLVNYATLVFNKLLKPDVISWNFVISGLANSGLRNHAWNYFLQLLNSEIKPNSYSIIAVLRVCMDESHIAIVQWLHGYVIKVGINLNTELITALIEMYMTCAEYSSARNLFEGCSNRDIVLWNTLIGSYVENNLTHEALPLFKQMMSEVGPDSVTVISILSSCSDMATLPLGQWLHAYTLRRNYFRGSNLSLTNAVLSMYARCGSMEKANKIFKTMPRRNKSSWNALIAGYGLNGQVNDALYAFSQMLEDGFMPNGRTLLSLLSACSHSGMVELGLQLFRSMVHEYNVTPTLVHYGCLVDLLGRFGHLDEANVIVESMPFEPDASIWRALLSACRGLKDLKLAEKFFEKLVQVEPMNAGNYVLMSNIYAANGLWSKVRDLRMHIIEKGLRKNPGTSWIFLRNQVHCFIAGDTSCLKGDEICVTLNSLLSVSKDDGYIPDLRWLNAEVD